MDNLIKTKQNSGNPLTYFQLEAQSDSGAVASSSLHASNTMHNVVESRGSSTTAIDAGISSEADISKFLARRVQIGTQQWTVGSDFNYTLQPWFEFLDNTAVKNKLQNYYMIKGDLKITLLINGTPFHAGMLLASYMYMNVQNEYFTNGGDTHIITRSQRPHVWMNASTNKGGCICVPYFAPTNYLSLTNPTFDADSIGTLHINSIGALKQINSGTDKVTVTVFAEMLNVKLTVPTMSAVALSGPSQSFKHYFDLEAQSDEYKEQGGIISGPASAIATYAGLLSSAPVIGPFAMATHIGAGAIGKIAKLFGYAKPAMVADIAPMRNFPVSSLALMEGVDTSQKLTATGKQELTIDSRVTGLDGEDTLSIKSIVSRESYVTNFEWAVTDVVGDSIFACHVDPMVQRVTAISGGYQIIPTALSFATTPFQAWSGTLKFRFQVIGSQYHRGRIAVIYDPTGPLTGDPFNVTYNTIIDLSEGRDFTIEFPWQQDIAYKPVVYDDTDSYYTQTSPEAVTTTGSDNGIFYLRVVNELVVPDGTTGVDFVVSVSAGDDFELANPGSIETNTSYFIPVAQSSLVPSFKYFDLEAQSAVELIPEEENAPEAQVNIMSIVPKALEFVDQKPMIFYGERILSFRQLLKRYTFVRRFGSSTSETTNTTARLYLRAMPPDNGYDSTYGPDSVITSLDKYMMTGRPMINYLKRSHAGWRGSIRWKFLPHTELGNISVNRLSGDANRDIPVTYAFQNLRNFGSTQTPSVSAWEGYTNSQRTNFGVALTQNKTMDALEVEMPTCTPTRFNSTYYVFSGSDQNTLTTAYPGGDTMEIRVTGANSTFYVQMDAYAAAGEDFTLVGWIGAPVVYASTLPQTV